MVNECWIEARQILGGFLDLATYLLDMTSEMLELDPLSCEIGLDAINEEQPTQCSSEDETIEPAQYSSNIRRNFVYKSLHDVPLLMQLVFSNIKHTSKRGTSPLLLTVHRRGPRSKGRTRRGKRRAGGLLNEGLTALRHP